MHRGLWDLSNILQNIQRVTKLFNRWIQLESWAIEGDSPVIEIKQSLVSIPSKAEHVKLCLNLRGPSRKAKYWLVTDSERVQWWKGEKNSEKLSEIDPETVSLQTARALLIVWLRSCWRMSRRVIFSCELKWLIHGGEGKPSLNRAKLVTGDRPEPWRSNHDQDEA